MGVENSYHCMGIPRSFGRNCRYSRVQCLCVDKCLKFPVFENTGSFLQICSLLIEDHMMRTETVYKMTTHSSSAISPSDSWSLSTWSINHQT